MLYIVIILKQRVTGDWRTMLRSWIASATFLLAACCLANAETAAERAGALKTWKDQCNDPDPDLLVAYIEAAIASGDMTVQRICVRQALANDNGDIQNLGLRAAVASLKQMRFDVALPAEVASAVAEAAGDADRLEAVRKQWHYVLVTFEAVQGGLIFSMDRADMGSGSSRWSPLINLSKVNDRFSGNTTIVGSDLTWRGAAQLVIGECTLSAKLNDGALLNGTFQCGQLPGFPVSGALL